MYISLPLHFCIDPSRSICFVAQEKQMEAVEEVVIVGAGLAGLATALGLHRKGLRSLVLESSESLRAAGFALTTWTNAWRALDALGVGDTLRHEHSRLEWLVSSTGSITTSRISLKAQPGYEEHEVRCVRRDMLLETLAKELPQGTIRYTSKVVSIEEASDLKLLHLADGSMLKTKVLVGSDGVNSVVSKWLGFKKPSFTGRSASRGFAEFPDGHGFEPEFIQFYGHGFRSGFLPCDERNIYWYFTWIPSPQDKEVEQSAAKMREFVVSNLKNAGVPEEVVHVIERSDLSGVVSSPLRYRWPFELIWASISKGNVCVTGDGLHPMTPDLGQGGCSALEDGVVLARCLGEALSKKSEDGAEGENERIRLALEKYARERRWRSFDLISTAYILGSIQQSDGKVMSFLRDKFLSGLLTKMYLKRADFDCGTL